MEKFRKFIAPFIEGLIVGVIFFIVLSILGIETSEIQFTIIMVTVFISTSLASAIARFIEKGDASFRYEWVYKYSENRIEVTAGLTEKLYINDELVDTKKGVSLKEVALKGTLKTGEEVSATITGGMNIKCRVLVGDKELDVLSVKGD